MSDAFQVYACFEFNAVDAPLLRAIKTAGRALVWRNEDLMQRFIVPFTLDYERAPMMEHEKENDGRCHFDKRIGIAA